MRRLVQFLCLLLTLSILIGCAPAAQTEEPATAPEKSGASVDSEQIGAVLTQQAIAQIKALGESPDDNYRTYYEVFVYSFCASDGDGIGDLKGLTSKLDYLQDLGITGLWLMPIHPSQSYHKYDVRDYYDIDPQYGTLADFDAFMAECQKRDIHVILDLVLNHTGDDNGWFLQAVDYLKSLPAGAQPDLEECPYVDYYFFSREGGSHYHEISGTDWKYEGMFSPDMPDVNFENEALWGEIEDIMRFWIDRGVSGFRLDAAKEFYSGNVTKNVEVLSRIQQTATAIKPDCYLVAEVWEGFQQIAKYYESGITSIFNFAFGNSDGKITKVIRGAGNPDMVSTYATALEKADANYLASNPDYIDAPFLSNHDVGRIAGFANRDENKIKLAGAMNVLMSGSCFIYYGEELGMSGSGNDPSKRAPMLWNEARDDGTTNPPPECELPEEYPLGSLEVQKDDDSSVYNYYRKVIALRNALPVISHGRTTCETALNTGCISAQRKTWGEETCIILMNIDPDGADVDLSAYKDWKVAACISADGGEFMLDPESSIFSMPAYGIAVLLPAA